MRLQTVVILCLGSRIAFLFERLDQICHTNDTFLTYLLAFAVHFDVNLPHFPLSSQMAWSQNVHR